MAKVGNWDSLSHTPFNPSRYALLTFEFLSSLFLVSDLLTHGRYKICQSLFSLFTKFILAVLIKLFKCGITETNL